MFPVIRNCLCYAMYSSDAFLAVGDVCFVVCTLMCFLKFRGFTHAYG